MPNYFICFSPSLTLALSNEELGQPFDNGAPWKRGAVISDGGGGGGFSGRPGPNRWSSPFTREVPNATSTSSSSSETQQQRPRLNLQPRTVSPGHPVNADAPRSNKIFGMAKPVDTASKDREIYQRMAR